MKQKKKDYSLFEKHAKDVKSLAVNEENSLVYSGSLDMTLRVWNLKTRSQETVISVDGNVVDFLHFDEINKWLVVVGNRDYVSDIFVYNWDLDSLIAKFKGTQKILSFSVLTNSNHCISQSFNSTFTLYQYPSLVPLKSFSITQDISQVVYCTNSIIYTNQYSLKIWNIPQSQQQKSFQINITQNSIIKSWQDLVIWSYFGDLYYTSIDSNLIKHLLIHKTSVISIANKDSTFITLSSDSNLVIWEINTNLVLKTLTLSPLSQTLVLLNSGSIVLADIYRTIKVINPDETWEFPGHDFEVTCSLTSKDDSLTITGSRDCSVRVWHSQTKRQISVFALHEQLITTLSLSHSARYLISGSKDSQVIVWDLLQSSCSHIFTHHTQPITCITSFNHSENAVASDQNQVISMLALNSNHWLTLDADFQKPVKSISILPQDHYCLCLSSRHMSIYKLPKLIP